MTFSAERTLIGSEFVRHVAEQEIINVPGDPGVTFTKGDRVCMSNGVAILATDSLADSFGIVTKTIVCPAATSGYFPVGPKPEGDLDGANAKTLIPVMMDLSAGKKIFAQPISGYQDETVVSYSAASRYIACTTGFAADDRPNGAIAYVYEGPGKGEINLVEDYDHTGGTVELMLVFHRPFKATLTTSSKLIVLSATGAANGCGFFGRMDLDDNNALEVDDGYDDGNYILYEDWHVLSQYLKNGAVPYINASSSWLVTPNA